MNTERNPIHGSIEEFAEAHADPKGILRQAKSIVEEAQGAVSVTAKGVADVAHECIRDNPWRSIGLAAVAGVIIGVLLNRR
jgi:ElaB/YqjD/DUF883 family membrane-anchored ribosome-binding protein